MKSKKTLILEVGERTIKACGIVMSKKQRRIGSLEAFEFSARPGLEDIEKACAQFKKEKYEDIIISLSRRSFLIKYLELPSSDEKEIKRMVPFQAQKKIFSLIEDADYDYSVTRIQENSSKLLFFIIQKKMTAGVVEFIKKNKIEPLALTINSWGLYNWAVTHRSSLKSRLDFPFVLIDIDKDSAQFLAAGNEGIKFCREFSYHSQEDILTGISQSLKILEKEFPGIKLNEAIFTGIKKEAVIEKISWAKAYFINSWDTFSLSAQKAARKDFSFTSVLGLSRALEPARFDFSPQTLKEKRQHRQKRKKRLKVLAVGAEIVLLCGILVFNYIAGKYLYSGYLDSKLEEIKVEAKELDKIAGKLKILTEEFSNKGSFSEILYDLISSLPAQARLTFADFKENGDFAIKGHTASDEQVFGIKAALSSSKLLEEVKIKYASRIKQDNEKKVEFYIYGKRRGVKE